MGSHSHRSPKGVPLGRSSGSSCRSRSRSRSRSQRRTSARHPDDGGSERKRSRSRVITEEEIEAYKVRMARKKALPVGKRLKSRPVAGYSNASNPFGDSNLNEKFVWKKTIERDVELGAELDMFSIKSEKNRRRERMAEIEKAKKRREMHLKFKCTFERGSLHVYFNFKRYRYRR